MQLVKTMQRYLMLDTQIYETVKPNPSNMDDTYAQALKYIPHLLSIFLVLNLKDTLGRNIFVYCGNEECLNGALKVVDFSIFS